jgi:Tfp pilus assembly protein PilE
MSRSFSLLEVLVACIVVGVVAAVAITHYYGWRARTYDSVVMSAVRNAATAQEAFFTRNGIYASDPSELETTLATRSVALTMLAGNSGDLSTSFRIEGRHANAEHHYEWVSDPRPGEPHLTIQ